MSQKPYQKYTDDQDFSNLEYAVIGSGIGGLTTATWLAKSGKKVAVFERHYVPGGFTHSFKRPKGFQWDVGVHYVGNVNEGNDLRGMFDFLTDYKQDWEPMGEVYDVVHIGNKTYEFKAGEEHFRKQMINYFPNEVEAIDQYLNLLRKSN